MQLQSTPPKPRSGAANRRRRVERGLPRYSAADIAARTRHNAKYSRAYAKAKWSKRSAFINTIKTERGCIDCGYREHPAALDFDHIPGVIKVNTISRLASFGTMAALIAEMEKCEIVCANCHRIRTFDRRRAASA